MEKRNQKLTIIVGALLLVIGVSFSYFLATSLIKGNGASTKVTTARINGATLNVEGTLNIEDENMLPGHKSVSAIKVTATGNNQLIAYNLIWKGTNEISQINYTVYKSSTTQNVTTSCSNKTSVANGMQVLSEECSINNIDTLGEAIAEGSINKGDTKVTLASDEFITATSSGTAWYYYVVLEYPNLNEDQSSDANAIFEGEVTVEESNKEADINILAVYIADDSGNYTEVTDIPQEGYGLNTEKSTCSNGAIPGWDYSKSGLLTTNLTKSGTSCYLYFDKDLIFNDIITNVKEPTENMFANVATTDEGVFKVDDPVYGGISYYYRGAVTNNYVRFAGFCWRVIRINGDGSIRMIYDGTTCHANGTSTLESIVASNQPYNIVYSKANHVGWTYEGNNQRTLAGTASNAKTLVDNWYTNYIVNLGYDEYVIDGKFCNDRDVASGYSWSATSSTSFYYAPYERLTTMKKPTLNCNEGDVYILKAGVLSADEISLAGGVSGQENQSYYLYNGNTYWTMSPESWATGSKTMMYIVYDNGKLSWTASWDTSVAKGIRPVINLRADTIFKGGAEGTLDSPYVVAN